MSRRKYRLSPASFRAILPIGVIPIQSGHSGPAAGREFDPPLEYGSVCDCESMILALANGRLAPLRQSPQLRRCRCLGTTLGNLTIQSSWSSTTKSSTTVFPTRQFTWINAWASFLPWVRSHNTWEAAARISVSWGVAVFMAP